MQNMEKVNKTLYEILEDMQKAIQRKDRFEAEICYWQLHGALYVLDLLGLYDRQVHGPIDRAMANAYEEAVI